MLALKAKAFNYRGHNAAHRASDMHLAALCVMIYRFTASRFAQDENCISS